MTSIKRNWPIFALLAAMLMVFAVSFGALTKANAQQGQPLDPALTAGPTGGTVPGSSLGSSSDSELWRAVRSGTTGTVSIPDKKAGLLVQSEGENWRAFRNGPLAEYSAYALLGTLALLALFFLIRGKVMIESGRSEHKIERFKTFERMGHWLLATSFIILALTGLNLKYGRYFLIDIIGPEAFTTLILWGKYLHNYVAFAFILGLIWIVVTWVWYNIPHPRDLVWFLKGGGLFSKHSHPAAKKFNGGQKIIFWLTVLGGASVSLSGWALLFPFSTTMFADTFVLLNNWFGTTLPTALTPIQEQQFAQAWHTMMSVFLICVIMAHIYIGSVGMQGAFDAMGTGQVDLNWAKEHHSLWVEEVQAKEAKTGKSPPPGATQPAE